MKFSSTTIPDVILVNPLIHQDDRGYFFEAYRDEVFSKAGLNVGFVQDNQSGSEQNVLRGLHYQIQHPQGKLVRVIRGEIFDVAVDLRGNSPTFGKHVGTILTAKSKQQLWIPPGFAHGFYVLSSWAEVFYKTTDYYYAEWERTLLWNDPELGIDWPIIGTSKPIISPKDQNGLPLRDAERYS